MSKEEKELLIVILEQMDRRLNFNMSFIGALNHEVKKLMQQATGQSAEEIDNYMNAIMAEMGKLGEQQKEMQVVRKLIEGFKNSN